MNGARTALPETEVMSDALNSTQASDALLAAILAAFGEARAAPPKRAPAAQPLPRFRDLLARHRAGAVATLLAGAGVAAQTDLARSLAAIAGASPLASAVWPDCAAPAAAARAEIDAGRAELILGFKQSKAGAPARRLFNDAVFLLQFGEIDAAKAKLAAIGDADPMLRQLLEMRILQAEGYIGDADALGVDLIRRYPDTAPADAGLAPAYRRVGRPILHEPAAHALTPASAATHMRSLLFHDLIEEGVAFAARHIDLVKSNFGVALRSAMLLSALHGHASAIGQRIRAEAATLPIPSRISVSMMTGNLDRAALADLLREGAAEPEAFAGATWLPLIDRVFRDAMLPPIHTDEDRAALAALLAIGDGRLAKGGEPLTAAVAAAGYVCPDEANDLRYIQARAAANSDGIATRDAVDSLLTDRARTALAAAKASGAGLVLLATHGVRLGRGNYLPAAAAAYAGFRVKTAIGFYGLEFQERFQSYLDPFIAGGARIEIVSTKGVGALGLTQIMLAHLGDSGAVDVAPDGLYTAGLKVAAPWLLRPFPITVYPAQLALAKGALAAVAAVVPQPDGRLLVDLVPLAPPPPAQGSLQTRAAWLTQRFARAVRAFDRATQAPVTLAALNEAGGMPRPRALLPLADWHRERADAMSLFAWIAGPPVPPATLAYAGPNGVTTRADLQHGALKAAAMLLHFQDDKPAHGAPDRRFLDQHRVMAILPKGETLLALALGALASGSLFSVAADDLSHDVMAARIRAFQPDLIVAGASAWSGVLAQDAAFNTVAALIVDDAGDAAALADLTESFDPATALPAIQATDPGLVVFTSGSDGAQKGVTLANAVHGGGSGLDALLNLTGGDRVAYLTRWDAVGLTDILACIRGGAGVVLPDALALSTPARLIDWMNDTSTTVLSMPASIWRPISASAAWRDGAPAALRAGVLWGERIDWRVIGALRETAPDMDAFATFGASEATYIGFGRLSGSGDRARYGDDGASPGGDPVPGTTVRIIDGDAAADSDEIGQIEVTGPDVMLGYFDVLAAENASPDHAPIRAILLADHARVTGAGTLEIVGRADAIVKIAGRRLSLLEAQHAAEGVPGVGQAVAFARPGAQGTDRLLLALESRAPDTKALEAAVAEAVVARTFPGARPERMVVLPQFPFAASGKLDRAAILRALEGETQPPPSAAPDLPPGPAGHRLDETTILKALAEWAQTRGKVPGGSFDPNATAPTLDSIDSMDLMLLIEETTGQRLDAAPFDEHGPATWRALAAALAEPPSAGGGG